MTAETEVIAVANDEDKEVTVQWYIYERGRHIFWQHSYMHAVLPPVAIKWIAVDIPISCDLEPNISVLCTVEDSDGVGSGSILDKPTSIVPRITEVKESDIPLFIKQFICCLTLFNSRLGRFSYTLTVYRY